MLNLAFVVQRYGSGVTGTAENLARDLAERAHTLGMDVTVFTTTAQNDQNWENHFPSGESILRGVRILRYPIQKSCDTDTFKKLNRSFFSRSPEARDDVDWLRMRGPNCPDLKNALVEMEKEFDLFIFFSCIDRSTLEGISCLHTKPVALFPVVTEAWQLQFSPVREVIQGVDTLFFLSASEQEAVQRHRYDSSPAVLLRYGIQVQPVAKELMRRKYGLILPYMLYAGRIEAGRELEPVFEAYRELRRRRLLNLVIIGRQLMDIAPEEGVIYLGYLSEMEKKSAMAGALFTIHPAPQETISSMVLESYAQMIPILASDKSPVFCEHARLGAGGALYQHVGDFVDKAEFLIDNLDQRHRMGRSGLDYVETFFSWKGVMDQFIEHVKRIVNHGH